MKKTIDIFSGNKVKLIVKDESRSTAWGELAKLGVDIEYCSYLCGEFVVMGKLRNVKLTQIEQLERDGWTWK
jgi:hypothetical protein